MSPGCPYIVHIYIFSSVEVKFWHQKYSRVRQLKKQQLKKWRQRHRNSSGSCSSCCCNSVDSRSGHLAAISNGHQPFFSFLLIFLAFGRSNKFSLDFTWPNAVFKTLHIFFSNFTTLHSTESVQLLRKHTCLSCKRNYPNKYFAISEPQKNSGLPNFMHLRITDRRIIRL